MLKQIKTKARPRLFKPGISKSRWKSNLCVGMAVFLLLLSVSLLHTKLGAHGTHPDRSNTMNSAQVSKSPAARKELITKDRETIINGKARVSDEAQGLENSEQFHARFGEDVTNENLELRENLEINEGGEDSDDDDNEDEDANAGDYEMEGFDGFEDKIDEIDEDEVEGRGGNTEIFSERSLSGRESHGKDSERLGAENGSEGRENSGKSKAIEDSVGKISVADEGHGNSGKSLERLEQIKTIPRSNYSDEQSKTRYYIQSKEMITQKTKSLQGRAGFFWDHVMGVTRRAFLKHPQRLVAITNTAKPKIGHGQESNINIDIQTNGEWEDAIADDSVAGNNDRIKEAFSSDDEPIDEGIRNGLEEVYAIEDALLLKGSERLSPLRSGWGTWFDTIQRRASKSDFFKRDRMAKSTVDLLNPMNNPLLQDPDAVGPAGLTKSDRAIQKALRKASIEGIPFVGKQSLNSKDVPEEEMHAEGKRQVHDAVALQKTLEESNLDGGDEASVKERNNSDNDDDALLKIGLTQLTRKALDESDINITHLESNVGSKNSGDLTDSMRGTEQIQSATPEQVVERKRLSDEDSKDNINSLGKNSGRSKKDAHRSNSRRNRVQLKKQGAQNKEETARRLRSLSVPELQEYKFQGYANGTLLGQVNSLRVQRRIVNNSRDVFPKDNIVTSIKSMAEDMDKIALNKRGIAHGDSIKITRGKGKGTENFEKLQRPGEPRNLNSASQAKFHRKVRRKGDFREGDTRRWGYFPGLDPLLSFSEFMDEFLQDENCSLRVFMAWTTPSWSYSVRYQRGLESLFYFHPHACVMVFSDSIELDFFNDFVNDGYRVAVVMPNLDELLVNTPAHIFSSVWLDWRKVDLYYIHYTELLRVAALYKYGGVYLDSDIVVLKELDSLNNTIGIESPLNKEFTLNGAVMAFAKHSSFLLECLSEFTATYDDTLLRWNGAELLTRVAKRSIEQSGGRWVPKAFKIQSHWAFFPLSFHNISSYFTAPNAQYDKEMQEVLFDRILNGSFTLHFWNNVTSKLVPESGSLVERILNYYCLYCTDFL